MGLLLGAEGEACALSDRAVLVVQKLIEAIERHGVDEEPLYGPQPVSSGLLDPRQALDKDICQICSGFLLASQWETLLGCLWL
ncbi:unnamed protein product [Arctogadus glacialis]